MLIVYVLVELIIETSHLTKDYLIVDIHTQHTSLCSMNAIFICVIVFVKMFISHAQSLSIQTQKDF